MVVVVMGFGGGAGEGFEAGKGERSLCFMLHGSVNTEQVGTE